jgi:hypothetical protein
MLSQLVDISLNLFLKYVELKSSIYFFVLSCKYVVVSKEYVLLLFLVFFKAERIYCAYSS